jgi:hypothetical protein
MTDLNALYHEAKFWLPMVTIFGIVIKAWLSSKQGVSDWADKLLNNHLAGIETATQSTETETKKTNELLRDHAGKLDMVQATLSEHHEHQLEAWKGITESLIILKERTRTRTPATPKKRK